MIFRAPQRGICPQSLTALLQRRRPIFSSVNEIRESTESGSLTTSEAGTGTELNSETLDPCNNSTQPRPVVCRYVLALQYEGPEFWLSVFNLTLKCSALGAKKSSTMREMSLLVHEFLKH